MFFGRKATLAHRRDVGGECRLHAVGTDEKILDEARRTVAAAQAQQVVHHQHLSVAIGASTSLIGAYLSYFLDGATGGIIICLQTAIFLLAFVFAPKHGTLAARRRAAEPAEVA